jgi:hypothetical protein
MDQKPPIVYLQHAPEDDDEILEILRAIREEPDTEEVMKLLRARIDLIAADLGTGSALHLAVEYGRIELMAALIRMGYSVNCRTANIELQTPVEEAVNAEQLHALRYLLEHGADPNLGKPLLFAVVESNKKSLEIVKILESFGADLHHITEGNKFTKNGQMNALTLADFHGKRDVVEYLASRGCVMVGAGPPLPIKYRSRFESVVTFFHKWIDLSKITSQMEIVPTGLPIVIHKIPSTKKRRKIVLFTTGCSDAPLELPNATPTPRLLELFLELESNWDLEDLSRESSRWPLDYLRSLARSIHADPEYFDGPVAILANGDPPRPIFKGSRFNSFLLLQETETPDPDGIPICFFRVFPLLAEERNLAIRDGVEKLLLLFDQKNVAFVIHNDRESVV